MKKKRLTLTCLLSVCITLSAVNAFGHLVGDEYTEDNQNHQWIIKMAVKLIRECPRESTGYHNNPVSCPSLVANKFPLEQYLPDLYYGAWYADNTPLRVNVKHLETSRSTADQVHHYWTTDTITTN